MGDFGKEFERARPSRAPSNPYFLIIWGGVKTLAVEEATAGFWQ